MATTDIDLDIPVFGAKILNQHKLSHCLPGVCVCVCVKVTTAFLCICLIWACNVISNVGWPHCATCDIQCKRPTAPRTVEQ